eukprot:6214032-Pleurochrysis_carterae.AAC.1
MRPHCQRTLQSAQQPLNTAQWKWTLCMWKATTGSVRKETGLSRQGQLMDEMPGMACKAAEDLEDLWGDHVSAPQGVLPLRLDVRESKRGTESRESGGAQPMDADGACDFELEQLVVCDDHGLVTHLSHTCLWSIVGRHSSAIP